MPERSTLWVCEWCYNVCSTVVALVIISCCGLPPMTVSAQTSEGQLIGFTNTSVTGDAGLPAMTLACSQEYPESHLCTTDEIVSTLDPPLTTQREYAWVHSVLQVSLEGNGLVFDSLGKAISLPNNHSPNCEGWSWAATAAVTITTDSGSALVKPCSEARVIACCRTPQPSLIFADDFEDGTTAGWSSVSE